MQDQELVQLKYFNECKSKYLHDRNIFVLRSETYADNIAPDQPTHKIKKSGNMLQNTPVQSFGHIE